MLYGWEVFDLVVLVLSKQVLDGIISMTFVLSCITFGLFSSRCS